MEVLGKLGIDLKLLFAQIINFGLLLWILKRYLYKPVVDKIERDEKELNEARIEKKELSAQRLDFETQQKKISEETHKKVEMAISDAVQIAEKIKKDADERAKSEIAEMTSQMKKNLETLRPSIEHDISEKVFKETLESLKIFTASLSANTQKTLNESFWPQFIKSVEELNVDKIKSSRISAIVGELEKDYSNKKLIKKEFQKKATDTINQILGPSVIYSTFPLENKKLSQIESLISNKIGVKIYLKNLVDENLLSGFTLEVAGIIIENNLRQKINI